jgi:hypothetical protein
MAFRTTPDPHPFNVAAVALEETQALAKTAPATALSPLSEEMESLKRDLNGAVQFVIASVP